MTTYIVGGVAHEASDEVIERMAQRGEIAQCLETEEWHSVDDLTAVHGRCGEELGAVCQRALDAHYFYCRHEDIWTHRDDTVNTREGRISLAHYRDAEYFQCESCEDHCHPNDYAHDGICTSCDEGEQGIIREYHSQSAPEVLGVFNADGTTDYRREALYFGVELEVECDGDLAESADRVNSALGGRTLFQTDGSLNHGYEIITAPMALSVQREMWDLFSARCARGLSSHNTSTCGMHVHVSARAVSPLQLGRILVFVNDPRNAPFIDCIAQRGNGEYTRKKQKKLIDARARGDNKGHCDAVNIGNSATIEFRIFKGNLRPDRIIKNLEFVAALLDYCKAAGSGELLTVPFLAWCAQPCNRKTYPVLYAYLCEKGYATPYNKRCKESRSQPDPEGN